MKLKTNKSIAKRFKFKKKSKKIIKRACGQNHFNSRETGKVGRNKKSDIVMDTYGKTIRASMAV